VHASCPWGTFCIVAHGRHWSLRTVQNVLSLRTELNSNAVTCKVCARSCGRLRWGVHTQPHQCTNPEQSCGSDAGFKHIIRTYQRRDRGIYGIRGGRSLYCLHFGIGQLIGPEACFGILVRVLLSWLSNLVSDIFSKFVPLVSSRGDASKRRKTFWIWPFNLEGILATIACIPTAWYKRDGFTENQDHTRCTNLHFNA